MLISPRKPQKAVKTLAVSTSINKLVINRQKILAFTKKIMNHQESNLGKKSTWKLINA